MSTHQEIQIDPTDFREVMGQYPTGVVIITAASASGEALGMTVGSFNSASLDPALVMFMPDRKSNSWRALRDSGERFGVNVLSAEQEPICRAVATRKTDKFEGIPWRFSDHGNPVIGDCVAHLDCEVVAIHEAGDHDIVIGRVVELGVLNPVDPLLFFRGGYGSFAPRSLAAADADLLEQLRLIDSVRTMMDDLAQALQTEVTASCLVRHELVLAAASGRPRSGELSQVGRRVAFTPPFGSVFAAWASPERLDQWLRAASPISEDLRQRFLEIPELVRSRGYAITLPHGGPNGGWRGYNPTEYRRDQGVESITAPVFGPAGDVAFALTIWGGQSAGDLPTALLVERITETARNATEAIGGQVPAYS
ncbi:MAG: flavin reductase family protein [Microthrixaceae bacterium]